MAPAMVLSTVAVPSASHYGQGVGSQVPRGVATQGMQNISPVCKLVGGNCVLLSEDRRIQSKFSLQALKSRGRKELLVAGAARAELAADYNSGNVIDIQSADEMRKLIEEAGDQMVVVDISTTTCGPCKLIFPKVVKMSTEYPDVVFCKINGDTDNGTRTLMRDWGVRAVPNFRFFKNGKCIHSHSGAKEDELRAHFLTHYANTVNVSP